MTREETIEAIKVMQAYVDGKEIEYYDEEDSDFYNCIDPDWNWEAFIYRIKEEPKIHSEYKVIPEELWNSALEKSTEPKPFDWRGKNIQWMRSNGNLTCIYKVLLIQEDRIWFFEHLTGQSWILYKDVNHWQWSEDNATWRKFE